MDVSVKIPQIVKIWRAGSGVGVSVFAQGLELLALTAGIGYSTLHQFPFSAWGDAVFLAIQTTMVIMLVLHFGGRGAGALGFLAAYSSVIYYITSPYAYTPFVSFLQASNIPIVISSRLIQAYQNYSNQSTGQLSVITVFLMFIGSLARIFTSVQETGDNLMVTIYITSSMMNGLIFSQILIYWGKHPRKKLI